MCSQQIVCRIRIKLIQTLVDLIGILDFGNILGRSQNLFLVQDCSVYFFMSWDMSSP